MRGLAKLVAALQTDASLRQCHKVATMLQEQKIRQLETFQKREGSMAEALPTAAWQQSSAPTLRPVPAFVTFSVVAAMLQQQR